MKVNDIEMTDKIRERLKAHGMLGFEVENTFKYVPKYFRDNNIPKNFWPVFTLKSKNGIELAQAEDNLGYINLDSTERRYFIESGKNRIETLKSGIQSVKNFILENGKVITTDNIDIVLKHMSAALQVELQNAINERTQLTQEELLGLE